MSGEEASSSEQQPTQYSLGLDRLNVAQRNDLERFIDNEAPWVWRQFHRELDALEGKADPEFRARSIEELADGEDDERDIACSLVPQYAERNPEAGFPLWAKLMKHVEGGTFVNARRALAYSLGVRNLDPDGVDMLLDAYSDAMTELDERLARDDDEEPQPKPH